MTEAAMTIVESEEEFLPPAERPAGVIMPVADATELVAAMRAYEETRSALMTRDDVQETREGRSFPKKSYFTKLSIAYGTDVTIKEGYPILHYDEHGELIRAECVCQAKAPNGRVAEGYGACSVREPRYTHQYDDDKRKPPRWRAGDPIASARAKLEHDLPATASTRASNRALSAMFGYSGEVSWEEVDAGPVREPGGDTPASARPQPAQGPTRHNASGTPGLRQQLQQALEELSAKRGEGEKWQAVFRIGAQEKGIDAKGMSNLTDAQVATLRTWADEQLNPIPVAAIPAESEEVIEGEVVDDPGAPDEDVNGEYGW